MLDLFQVQHDEGPCVWTPPYTRAGDQRRSARSSRPLAAVRSARHSERFRSVHAIPLRLRSTVIGALNLFGADVGGLGPGHGESCRHSRTSPRPRFCRSVPSITGRSSPSSSRVHSTAGWSSSRPKAPSPTPTGWGLIRHSSCCAGTPAITTAVWSTSRRRYSWIPAASPTRPAADPVDPDPAPPVLTPASPPVAWPVSRGARPGPGRRRRTPAGDRAARRASGLRGQRRGPARLRPRRWSWRCRSRDP
jgi:hypothetical protein